MRYVELLINNEKNIKELITQIKNEMVKPIDKNLHWTQVWDIWDARNKSIKQKEKGLKRHLIKRNKLYRESMCGTNNKIKELIRTY